MGTTKRLFWHSPSPVSYTHLQGEEEKNAADLITKMDLFGGDSKGLYMLNSELKARVYTDVYKRQAWGG